MVARGQSATGHLYQSSPSASHTFGTAPAGGAGTAKLLDGVDEVKVLTACTVTAMEGLSAPLLIAADADVYEPRPAGRGILIDGYDLTSRTSPVVVAAVSNIAKVVAIGSWKLFLDPFLDDSASSRRLLLNLASWLTAADR